MNLKILKQLWLMSKLSLYGFLLQVILYNCLLAKEGEAQKMSIEDIYVEVNINSKTLSEVFRQIERKTEFSFIYSRDIVDTGVKLSQPNIGKASLASLLRGIATETNYGFKRVNDNIYVRKRAVSTVNMVEDDVAAIQPVQVRISGKVTAAEDGEPLPGVSILIKGTSTGSTTDIDGNYSLSAPEGSILQFSYIGFLTQEVTVGSQTTLNISLQADLEQLEEVVVIGYGSQKKKDVTGSVASVEGKAISNQNTVNVSQALQGQVPGVSVVNTSGSPGAGAQILIRGQGSFDNNISPLYIIDGAISDRIDFLNPNDIESIEILKDASAAAIYGSRAANGVVIVTTKRGKSGELQMQFSANFGMQTLARELDFASSQQWRDKEVWMFENEGIDVPVNLQTGNFNPSVSTDWQDELFSSAFQQDYNFQVSGGGENSNFNFSLGYIDQESVLEANNFERINVRVNSDFDAGKFTFGESLSLSRSVGQGVGPFSFRPFPAPVFSPRNEEGDFQAIPDGFILGGPQFLQDANPLAFVSLTENETVTNDILFNTYGQYEIIEGLNIKASISTLARFTKGTRFDPTFDLGAVADNVADLNESRDEFYSVLWENTLNYSKSIADHNFNAVVGWTRQLDQTNEIDLRADGFPNGITSANAAQNISPLSGGDITEVALESYLGRLNYNYADKYLLTATVRRDASSRLREDLRDGTFASFSAGWVISEESFFPENNVVNRLKLRGGYGEIGRLNAVGPYQVQNTLTLSGRNTNYVLGSGQSLINGVSNTGIVNTNLLWERAQTINVALEAALLENKITFLAEYFVRNTQDLQFESPIPNTVGVGNNGILVNAGDIENRGLEFNLGFNDSKGDFSYYANANIFFLNNEILELNNPDDAFIGGQYGFSGQDATRAEVGTPLSNFWLIKTDGIFQSQEEIDAHSKDGVPIQPNAQPGDLKFVDFNDDGVINNDDRQFIEGSIPDFEYGINLGASYKNFDLSMVWQGVAGQKIFNGVNRTLQGILADQSTDYWREDNTGAEFFRPSTSDPNGNNGPNDFFLEDASYLRLRNLQIGYNLPQSFLDKLKLTSARLSFTGINLLTFTSFSGYDPENISFGLNRGVNTNIFPQSRTYLFGLNVNF